MEMQKRFVAMEIRMGSSSPKNTAVEYHNYNILESIGDEKIGCNKDQQLESAMGEMGEVREENERLKLLLERLVKDYQSLQTHCFDILQQNNEEATKSTADHSPQENEESELVSLSLGLTSKDFNKDEKKNSSKSKEDENLREGLALGLDLRFNPSSSSADQATNITSPESVFDEEVREEPTEIWPPSKVLKTMKNNGENIQCPQQTHQLKKARVSIRARCDTQTMHDGCQWRKYGQKIAKGNPCPRSYYRCTVSPSCPVRRQVQRCSEDMSILITTYEGTHNHPLPISATAMASTTSAAASMLQSPSLSTLPGLANPDTPIFNPAASNHNNFNALNFSTCHIPRPQQFYFPNSSISTSNSHPTITLDLTAPPPTSSHFGKLTSAFSSNTPKFSSSTGLNFSSTFSPLQSSIPQSPWSSTYSNYFNNGTLTSHNRNQGGSILNTGKQPFQGHLHHFNYMNNHPIPISSHQPLPETIAAATKAITSNPKFQSALAAALTTYVGKGAVGNVIKENQIGTGESAAALNLKLGGGNVPYTKNMVYTSTPNGGMGCASSNYLNMSTSAANSHQQGNLVLFPPPLPSPPASNKRASTSPCGKSSN